MKTHSFRKNLAQRGMVLVSSLLLLIVVTIIALSMFRSFGIQEKIAGNVREKQRALQAAVSAESFAENWLSLYGPTTPSAPCSNLLNGNIGQGQICSNALTGPTPAVADVTGIPMSSHLYPEVSGHLLRVTPTRQWLEWQDWAHPVLARPFEVRSGELHLPDVPGNGLEWDEGAVAHYQAGL